MVRNVSLLSLSNNHINLLNNCFLRQDKARISSIDIRCCGRNNIITFELFFEPLDSSDLMVVLLDTRFLVFVAGVIAELVGFVDIGGPALSSLFSMVLVVPGLDCAGKGGGAKLVCGGGTAFWDIAADVV